MQQNGQKRLQVSLKTSSGVTQTAVSCSAVMMAAPRPPPTDTLHIYILVTGWFSDIFISTV